jgi:GxxExxY protein
MENDLSTDFTDLHRLKGRKTNLREVGVGMSERDPRTFAIIGAAMEVHRVLGCGFVEPVYQDALAVEFASREIPFLQAPKIEVRYKSVILTSHYEPDFICYSEVIVELKALTHLSGVEDSQVLNYLKATGLRIGLLLNFGASSLTHKRLVAHDSWKPLGGE